MLTATLKLLLAVVVTQQGATERDLARIRVQEQQQPWLTLNAGGHTATVNALAFTPDSKRLYSAGLDKAVHVWEMAVAVRDLSRRRLLERSLRWPVNRGLRGGIYCLAVAPNDGLLAVAGYGASTDTGEIWLIEPKQATLVKLLRGHRQAVMSLGFSADGNWLASLDAEGKAILWQRGAWEPSIVHDTDTKVYGAQSADLIAAQPQLRPLAMLGSEYLLLPVFIERAADGKPRWKLERIKLADRKDARTLDTAHSGMITALAATGDGRRFASADLSGNLFVWDAAAAAPAKLASSRVVLSLAFTPDGKRLLAGTAIAGGTSEAQLWDLATGQIVQRRALTYHVRACAVSPDGRQIAYTGGDDHAVFAASLADFPADSTLRSSVRSVQKVAFASQEPIYRLAFGNQYRPGPVNDQGPLQRSFDPHGLALTGGELNADDWLTPLSAAGGWRAELVEEDGRRILHLFQGGQRRGYVHLQTGIEGRIRSFCFVPDAKGQPAAVAVGTDVQNSIYVCGLAAKGACPILRFFRGHSDTVTSLSASRDGRYLASGSADATVRVWSLSALSQGRAPPGRWGAELSVEANGVLVKSVDPAGPLFFKGVREGDELTGITWFDGQREVSPTGAEATLRELGTISWQTPLLFRFARNGADRPPFQLLPAWQPLANLFANNDGEWAFWTPEGYYDASPNGHTLFGWQVNRGVLETPDFYRADQFRKNLERPDVLERLLTTGSLDGALRQAMLAPPAEPEQVVSQQILNTPRITIATPEAGDELADNSALLRAIVDVPAGGELVQAKAFANGVVASEQRLLEQQQVEGHQRLTYEWRLGLPADERVLVQVVAGSAARTVALSSVLIERPPAKQPAERLPRLYLLALGVDRYLDPAIQPLAFAVADARSVVNLFRTRAPGLFTFAEPLLRVNEQVTRAQWKDAFAEISQRLKADVRPDDLLVIFMAGHGFVDQSGQQYYFVSQDFQAEDMERGVYDRAISWADFDLLADVPCRKLAFLDTCHSGAIQPLRDRDLKAAIRALQDDVVLTVAASAGHERSEEKPSWGHGAFTKTLLEGLSGSADSSHDGSISLDELIAYVKSEVPRLTSGRQNPAAAPNELLRYVSLRLTEAAEAGGE